MIIKKIINRFFEIQTAHNILYFLSIFRRLFIKTKKNRSMMDVFNKHKFFVIEDSRLLFTLRDLGNSSIARGKFFFMQEQDVTSWIDSFHPKSNFLDIGANIGVFSLYAAKRGHNIISIEPESLNFAALNININDNNFNNNIRAYPFSIDSEKKIGMLELSELNWGKSGHNFNNKTIDKKKFLQGSYGFSIDTLAEEINFVPDYVKVDVDGNELKVLNGMKKLLKNKSVTSILVEIDIRREENNEIFSLLTNYGYAQISKNVVAGGPKVGKEGVISFEEAKSLDTEADVMNYIFEK